MNNPFTIISPEKLDAATADQLFVEVFSDFPQVKDPGHAMITGARGSGKSMMFRCLLPDVLVIKEKCSFSELQFLAFHIPIKNTQLKITELRTLDEHYASFLINEHFFVLNILLVILKSIIDIDYTNLTFSETQYKEFFEKVYTRRLTLCGCNSKCNYENNSVKDFFQALYNHAEEMHTDFVNFIKEISFEKGSNIPPYNLPLLSFLGFLVPFLNGLKKLPGFPNKNIYLFIDDADNLSKTQTQILNSWLATRTQPEISLKISTQIGKYKSYISTNGTLVESPHDYQEINISDIYTTSRTSYYKRICEIVDRRLDLAGIKNITSEEYFPPYEKQEKAIKEEEERLRRIWEEEGRGYRPNDDALRYARPNYIKSLGGTKKARSTYMYAGMNTLVHLSSGVIRYFLDSAALMFNITQKEKGIEQAMKYIPHGIQDRVVREKADNMLFSQFSKLETDDSVIHGAIGNTQKLQNLIFSMGRTFHDILVSDRSERRVFSIALSNIPSPEIKEVLDLGVQLGYLQQSTIGNKEGTGRTWLYIMNRCLAPHFILDPTGFAGYLFITNDSLISAMRNGTRLREINNIEEPEQLSFF